MRRKILAVFTSVWFITLFAFAVRAVCALYKSHLIPPAVLSTIPFENEVGNVASALVQGQGFCCLFREPTGPTAWLAPVYPLLVAAIFKLFGASTLHSFYAAIFLNCVFSALACIPVFCTGKRIAGDRIAVLAAYLWALFPTGVILPFEFIWDTSLSALLAALLLWRTLALGDFCRRGDAAIYGLLWGLALLINPSLGVLFPFLLAWVLYRHRAARGHQLRLAAVTLGLAILTCIPWTIRNYVQFHRFVPMRSNFAYEFWSGNNEIFDEHTREVNRITRYEQTHLYARLGETAFLDEKWQKAIHFVRTHPRLYLRLSLERIVATWLGTPSPFRDFLRTDSSLARFLLLWNAAALAAIIIGLVRLYLGQRLYFCPVASYPLIFPATFYITHTTLRHRHPCDPVLALLIAVALLGTRNLRTSPKVG